MTKERLHKIINVIILVICLLAIVTSITVYYFTKPKSSQQVYADSLSGVVEIKATSENVGESYGTAIFIDKDGTLITNAHVVLYTRLGESHTFDRYEIRFATENGYREAELIKYDEQLDLALLKISETCDFKSVTKGNSDNLKAGDTVYAVGNAMNYGLSISQGIVSIPLLQIEYENNLRKVIQCDLTINEGNSGGALFDDKGRLVGITTFRTKDSKGNVIYGVAYCIPVNVINEFLA